MKSKLARVFIERKIIQRGAIIEAYHSVKGISGQYDAAVLSSFKLTGAQAIGEWVYFNVINDDKQESRIRCDYVISLDGMPVARIAESHHLTEDGEEANTGRRGRRKKPEPETRTTQSNPTTGEPLDQLGRPVPQLGLDDPSSS